MAYDLRPKASGDNLNASKNPIRNNFSIIKTDFAVNHIAFDDSGEGKHSRIDLPEQSTLPATPVDEGWAQSIEYNSKTELAWRPENTGAAGDKYILSGLPIRAGGSFDPSGATGNKAMVGLAFNIDSNQVNKSATNTIVVTFAEQLPNADYFVIPWSNLNSSSIKYGSKLTTGFTFTVANSPGTIMNFIVLGG